MVTFAVLHHYYLLTVIPMLPMLAMIEWIFFNTAVHLLWGRWLLRFGEVW